MPWRLRQTSILPRRSFRLTSSEPSTASRAPPTGGRGLFSLRDSATWHLSERHLLVRVALFELPPQDEDLLLLTGLLCAARLKGNPLRKLLRKAALDQLGTRRIGAIGDRRAARPWPAACTRRSEARRGCCGAPRKLRRRCATPGCYSDEQGGGEGWHICTVGGRFPLTASAKGTS